MAIWGIADLHASRTNPETGQAEKSMALFGEQWNNHMDRLERNWKAVIRPEDTVIIAGDIDWAMHLDEAEETLQRLDSWAGRKVLVRGNHDYWWSSKSTNRVRRALPSSITLIHNDSVVAEGYAICGAKGSPVPGGVDWTAENAKLLNREAGRLETSLAHAPEGFPIIAALHYPPFYPAHPDTPYHELLERFRAVLCVYGHLHGSSGRAGPRGRIGETAYRCVAADYVNFEPVLLISAGSARGNNGRYRGDEMDSKQTETLTDLAQDEMTDKRREFNDETRVQELYDIPSEPDEELAEQQRQDRGPTGVE